MSNVKMPEPLAWISTIQCIGAKDYGKEHYGKLPVQSLQQGYYSHTPLITIEKAEAYAQAVRDDALKAVNAAAIKLASDLVLMEYDANGKLDRDKVMERVVRWRMEWDKSMKERS